MADEWDDSFKRLFREHPQDFVTWLVNGATYLETVSGELKYRTRRADELLRITKHGKESLLHIEVQSKDDKDIEDRLIEYNLLATLTHKKPVISCLILLRPVADVPRPPLIKAAFDEIECWRFNFSAVKMWEIPADELVMSRLIGLLPLVPLTDGGAEQEALTTVVTELYAAGEYILLSLAKLIAGLKMRQPEQQALLERMFAMYQEVLEESWVYQEIKGKGLEEGLSQGEQRALLAIVQKRFPDILPAAQQLVSNVTDTSQLERLIADVSVVLTSQEALRVLRSARP